MAKLTKTVSAPTYLLELTEDEAWWLYKMVNEEGEWRIYGIWRAMRDAGFSQASAKYLDLDKEKPGA